MSAVQGIVEFRRDQIIEESAKQHRAVVVTQRTAQGWRTFKAELTAASRADRTLTFTLATIQGPGDGRFTGTRGETVGVTFRLGHRKCMFSSVVDDVRASDESTQLFTRWPDQVQQLQRRAYERAEPPRGSVVAVRFWIDNGQAQANQDRAVKHGQLEDISAGGMRIKAGDAADVTMGATYRCVFTPRPGAPALLLDATLRHREAGDHSRVSLGFQFLGLETTSEGRKTLDRLARLVSQFHRAANRFRPRDESRVIEGE